MVSITAGSTNVSLYVYFVDDDGGTAPGEPTTGKLFSNIETGGSASYVRQGAARTDLTLITMTVDGAHADGGFVLVDDTNMPGLYRIDYPDAAFATGADFVIIQCVMAAANNSIMRPLLVMLPDFDMGVAVPTVDVTQIGTDAQSATDLKDFADAGYDPATNKVQGVVLVDTNTDMLTAGEVWAVDATTQQTQGTFGQAIGDPVADTTTIYQSVATDAAGDNVAVDVVAVKAETVLILADTDNIQTRIPAALVGGAMDADVSAIQAGAITAAAIATDAVDADALATDAVNEIRDAILPKINTALNNIEFLMVLASDHSTVATGLTVTGTRSIDGSAFGAVTGTIAEVANGIYQLDASAADMNGGIITFRLISATADDTFLTIRTGG